MEKDVTAILRLASERSLPSLLIGANAVIMLGYIRNTVDLDLLVPEESRARWLDLMRELGYRFYIMESLLSRNLSRPIQAERRSI